MQTEEMLEQKYHNMMPCIKNKMNKKIYKKLLIKLFNFYIVI